MISGRFPQQSGAASRRSWKWIVTYQTVGFCATFLAQCEQEFILALPDNFTCEHEKLSGIMKKKSIQIMVYYSLKVSSTPDQPQNMPLFHLFINFLRELFDYGYLLHITLNLPPCNTHFLRLCSSSKNSGWATAKLICMTTVYLFICRYQYHWRQSYRYRQASSHLVNASWSWRTARRISRTDK